ncbi:DUF4834 family protein [Bacteroides sp. OttesenSCG-928-M17]|nr:DUF4834 family protein [Bacteroides sp. OttesenSCG-928-M17]
MSIITFLFAIIIFILLFGVSIINFILRLLFGGGRRSSSSPSQQQQRTQSQTNNKKQKMSDPVQRKKIFDKDDGEYVDFEEVKEDSEDK